LGMLPIALPPGLPHNFGSTLNASANAIGLISLESIFDVNTIPNNEFIVYV